MPGSGNLSPGYQLDSLPVPKVDPNTQPQAELPATQQGRSMDMPPVYRGGKAGSAAFVADRVLQGWMAGRKVAQERQQKSMSDEIGAAKTGLDIIGQNYRAAVESGDQKKIQEAKTALSESWNDYLNKAEKYAMPEDEKGNKKGGGIKGGVKRALGMDNPHLQIAQSTMKILRSTDPTHMYGPSKAEQQESQLRDTQQEVSKIQLRDAQHHEQMTNNWETIAKKPEAERTPQEKKDFDAMETILFGKSEEQKSRDNILRKIEAGAPLEGNEKQLAQAFGYIKPDVTSSVTRTVSGKDGKPHTQIVNIGPDGKVVGQPYTIPGADYVPPDQAELAGKMISSQINAMVKVGGKLHPDWNQQQKYEWATKTLYPTLSGTWFDDARKLDSQSRAIQTVLQRHSRTLKDPATGQETFKKDDVATNAEQHFLTSADDGTYHYNTTLVPKTQTEAAPWYKFWQDDKQRDWKPDELSQVGNYERQFLAEVRGELHKQNPKLTDEQITELMPKSVMSQRAGMSPTPNSGKMEAPPSGGTQVNSTAGGTRKVKIYLQDGGSVTRDVDPAYIDALTARGVRVEPVEAPIAFHGR